LRGNVSGKKRPIKETYNSKKRPIKETNKAEKRPIKRPTNKKNFVSLEYVCAEPLPPPPSPAAPKETYKRDIQII